MKEISIREEIYEEIQYFKTIERTNETKCWGGDIKDKTDKHLTSLREKKMKERVGRNSKIIRDYKQLYTNKFCNREHGEIH